MECLAISTKVSFRTKRIYFDKEIEDNELHNRNRTAKTPRTYFGLWAVIEKESNEFIGDCGITMQQGKGYATEVARACSDYAKSRGVKQIISYMKSDNLPSHHVAERNGMTFVKSFTKIVMGKVVEDEVL